jgi:hypothetical protein
MIFLQSAIPIAPLVVCISGFNENGTVFWQMDLVAARTEQFGRLGTLSEKYNQASRPPTS